MNALNIKYEKVGHVIMLDESDWEKLTAWMCESGISVHESQRASKRVQSDRATSRKSVKKMSASQSRQSRGG